MTADHHIYDGGAGHEPDFAINMAAMLRTAARAADELAGAYRELARRFADQVDDDLASDLDPSAPSVGQAFREVDQQGHEILVALHKHRTASDPSVDEQASAGIELAVTPRPCKYCPSLLLWARDEGGAFLPLDPRPFPAVAIAANRRWLPDRDVAGDNQPPRMRRTRDQMEGYAYRRHSCSDPT
jgi:hypothetical protein